jgi:catechol 2,3-dioxygenase-like lactoylglutathione lyase family enzyme
MKRRNFIASTISFSLLMAFHKEAQALSKLNMVSGELKEPKNSRFSKIILYTSKLEEQYEFYNKVLGFPIVHKDKKQFTIQLGESVLQFKKAKEGTEPLYHYAINIPSNKYNEAKKWLSDRTSLLLNGNGGEIFYFDFWDAHAMYFKDPSGNIGELIARHSLKNDSDGEFGISDLLCVSEIGTPVNNPSDFASELKKEYGLEAYGESMFIGDENGMFVVVKINRSWFPEFKVKASIHPTDIFISDNGKEAYQYKDYPYKIHQKK